MGLRSLGSLFGALPFLKLFGRGILYEGLGNKVVEGEMVEGELGF